MVVDPFHRGAVLPDQFVETDLGRESEVHGYERRACVDENWRLVAVFVLAPPGPGSAMHIDNDRRIVAGGEYVEGFVGRRAIGDVEPAIQAGAHLGAVARVALNVLVRVGH